MPCLPLSSLSCHHHFWVSYTIVERRRFTEARNRIKVKISVEIFWSFSALFSQAVWRCGVNKLGEEITLPLAKLGHADAG
jgi:hypothetical protein